jgi:hypothetical protein
VSAIRVLVKGLGAGRMTSIKGTSIACRCPACASRALERHCTGCAREERGLVPCDTTVHHQVGQVVH